MKKEVVFGILILFLVGFVSAVPITSSIIENDTSDTDDGLTTNSKGAKDTITSQNQTQNRSLTQTQIKEIKRVQNRITANIQTGTCPINCTCTGSVTKCRISEGREMTVRAGASGNTIVQVKEVNVTTSVALYKANETIYGVFRNNETRAVRILPDEIKDKIRQRAKARLENQTIELDEDGIYQVRAQKRARLFLLFPVRATVLAEINSETGEVVRLRDAWWSFLAKDIEEEAGEPTEGTESESGNITK